MTSSILQQVVALEAERDQQKGLIATLTRELDAARSELKKAHSGADRRERDSLASAQKARDESTINNLTSTLQQARAQAAAEIERAKRAESKLAAISKIVGN